MFQLVAMKDLGWLIDQSNPRLINSISDLPTCVNWYAKSKNIIKKDLQRYVGELDITFSNGLRSSISVMGNQIAL